MSAGIYSLGRSLTAPESSQILAAMPEPIVIPPGTGLRFGNLELLVLSEHTPRFNVGIVAVAPDRHGPPVHHHE